MKRKIQPKSKTPNPLEMRHEQRRKNSDSARFKKRCTKDKKQRCSIQKSVHTPRSKIEGVSETKIELYGLSRVLDEGQIQFMTKYLKTKDENWKTGAKNKRDSFQFISVIGCGVFGKVWKAKEKLTGKLFAIKQMSKAQIIIKKGLKICFNERNTLPQLHHHLIPVLYSAFQTQLDLYFVFPWLSGGDLRYHITKFKHFQQKEVRFFAACVIAVLEYLRNKQILHRDLKPQNLIVDQSGYLCVADYGIASSIIDSHSWFQCGTPAYMPPEILFEKQPYFCADYYALGVILYEMIIGERPYKSSDKEQLKQRISKSSISIKKENIPEDWSIESIDFVNRLLHRNPKNRLGVSGVSELKNHMWFKNFPWAELETRQLKSPYQESFKEWEIDFSFFMENKDEQDVLYIEKELLKGNMQQFFRNFDFEGVQKSVEWSTKPSFQLRRSIFEGN